MSNAANRRNRKFRLESTLSTYQASTAQAFAHGLSLYRNKCRRRRDYEQPLTERDMTGN